tara:strand:- start:438 stop:599 length:162 start_codon:yes stop_codon:yes gene_type:complete
MIISRRIRMTKKEFFEWLATCPSNNYEVTESCGVEGFISVTFSEVIWRSEDAT